jgi:hypothetical protein
MKKKISIVLSSDVLAGVGSLIGPRSAVIECLFRRYLRLSSSSQRRDLELINAAADQLNREAEDVLGYQSSAQS